MGVRGDVSLATPRIFIEVWLKEGFLLGHIRLNKCFHIHTSSQLSGKNLLGFPLLGKFDDMPKILLLCDV